MAKLRIGLIGAGGIAAAHLPQLMRRADDVAIVAAADVNPNPACAAKFSLPRITQDYREFIDDVDAVLICTPTHLHAEMAIDCLRRGKAVFCEKPIARTLEQADAILSAKQESGTPLQIGFVRRFDEEWLAFREALLAGRIGRPVVWRDIAASRGPAYAGWFNVEEIGGGPFLDGCIHNLDFGLDLFGPIEWVFCHGRTMRPGNTAIDTGSATVRFASGDELLLAWSWGLPEGCRGSRVFEFLGPGGTLTWPGDEPADATRRRFVVTTGKDAKQEIPFAKDALALAYDRQMDAFIEVAQGKQLPRVGGVEGRAALRASLAILESARGGKVVHLS